MTRDLAVGLGVGTISAAVAVYAGVALTTATVVLLVIGAVVAAVRRIAPTDWRIGPRTDDLRDHYEATWGAMHDRSHRDNLETFGRPGKP